jgi:hypothetical protein
VKKMEHANYHNSQFTSRGFFQKKVSGLTLTHAIESMMALNDALGLMALKARSSTGLK